MGMLAHEGPLETNTQPDLKLVPVDATSDTELLDAAVIPFPGPEIVLPEETAESLALRAALEDLLFQDTHILSAELQELGVFIEDLEGDNEGLGIFIDLGGSHVQHLRADYSSQEDALTKISLGDYWYSAGGEILAERQFDWAPGAEPADEIVKTADLVLAEVDQARVNKDKKAKRNARTYGHEVMERARQAGNS